MASVTHMEWFTTLGDEATIVTGLIFKQGYRNESWDNA
uniref:Uncharacterized protein n=1 Tax=Corticoviridae sp. TaxID=2832474 RepID=A0A8D9PE35_9VIRU|nr:MAG TPA: hypothetical protein [Corticoviridae sp.]